VIKDKGEAKQYKKNEWRGGKREREKERSVVLRENVRERE
jgi:hypothetical protein